MFKTVVSVAFALLLPAMAAAQVLAPKDDGSRYPLVEQLLSSGGSSLVGATTSSGPAIPLWASPDGRLLALVSLSADDGAPLLPRGPMSGNGADWRIIDATSLLSGGLRWQFSGGLAASATLSQSGSMGSCKSAGSICTSGIPAVGALTSSLGVDWSAADASSGFGYGVSWLRSNPTALPFGSDAAAALLSSSPAGFLPYRVDQGSSVFARGQFVVGNSTRVDLGASRGNVQLLPFAFGAPSDGPLHLDESTLSFGISQGNLRGTIVGRVIDSSGAMLPGQRWTLLDFGLSWRTPWQGQLSLGTRSYLAPKSDAPKADAEIAPSRVPYVQYRQDL